MENLIPKPLFLLELICSRAVLIGFVVMGGVLNPHLGSAQTFTGTQLEPGDVMFTMGNEGQNNKAQCNVAFVVLKDIVAGTQIAAVNADKGEWDADENEWGNMDKLQGVVWTAAADVSAGTEILCKDTENASGDAFEFSNTDSWTVTTGGEDRILGGVQCGSWVKTEKKFKDVNGKMLVLLQPSAETNWTDDYEGGEHYRWISAIGKDLSHDDLGCENTALYLLGGGTGSNGNMGNCDPRFCFEDDVIDCHQWRFTKAFEGGSSVETVALNATFAEVLCLNIPGRFDCVSDAKSPLNSSMVPHGNMSNASGILWSALIGTEGNEGLDITLDNGLSFVVDFGISEDNTESEFVIADNVSVADGTFVADDGNGRKLKLKGNVTLGNGATFDGNEGELLLDGSTDQILDAANYSDALDDRMKLKKVKILNDKSVTVKGHVKMKPGGSLDFDDSPSVTGDQIIIDDAQNSSLTLESTSQGTAGIGPCSSTNFGDGADQEFTFQRYIPADADGTTWVNIGAYVTGTTVGDWTSANSSMLVFQYNESNYGSLGAGWNYLWDTSTVLEPGSGYMALIPQGQDALINVTGPFKMGDVNISLTFTDDPNQSNETVDGWNLVSNPYPSPVNLVQVLSRVDGVEAFWIYDNSDAGSYITSNDMGVGDAPSTLDVGQSFWVKVSENQTLTFTEADKISEYNSFVREYEEGFEGSFAVSAANGDNQWSRAFIQFQAGSTSAYSIEEDALMYGDGSTDDVFLWTTAESGEKLSIQSLGSRTEVTSVPLNLTTGTDGTIRFTQHAHETAIEDVCGVIEDTETGEFVQIHVNDTVEVQLPANSIFTNRFVLHLTPAPTMEWQSTACDGLVIDLAGQDWESWDASWFANDASASGTGLPYELEDGDYTFEFTLPGSVCVQSVQVDVTTACLGDFNLNGERDVVDLLVILSGLPGGALETAFSEEADCDCDGAVTVNDMLTFLTVFGTACD